MPEITFIDKNGIPRAVTAATGRSLMEVARAHDIAGIVAECGGAASCSTCHVYIDPVHHVALPPQGPLERDLLDFAFAPDPLRSRLSCQIPVTEALKGLVVEVPSQQG